MIKKLGIVFIVLLIFVAAASVAYAGNPEGTGDAVTPSSRTYPNVTSGPAVYTGNVPAGASGSTQKDAGSKPATGSAPAGKETGTSQGKAGGAATGEDKEAKFWKAVVKVLEAGEPVDTGQFIVTLTSPEDLENELKLYEDDSLTITGFVEYTDTVVLIAMLNKETGAYELIELPDGDEAIDTGSGAFSTEFKFKPGEYNLLLIAYRASEMDPDRVQYTPISCKVLRSYLRWLGAIFGIK